MNTLSSVRASTPVNRIVQGDCVAALSRIAEDSVNLVFADPPFNIGYEYDRYHDSRPPDEYLDWSLEWMKAVKRVLKSNGAFWLAIGDEYAAELKVIATRELGLFCRSWVIWYYTFGVHCESKFTRSHAHLFHFVVDPKNFVFDDAAVRVPSARQLVYADKRANPKGRVPDDTWLIRPAPEKSWILRPQDLPEGMSADSDTWYFPRVCGTFRERMGFHGCQMPEQLLGRIIRACSNENDLVLDPFTGSGTTLAVAKKLGRKYLGFELSPDYTREAQLRLSRIHSGMPLDGAENPLSTTSRKHAVARPRSTAMDLKRPRRVRTVNRVKGLAEIEREILTAFDAVRDGFSADRVIADPRMNVAFVSKLASQGIPGEAADWNTSLLRMRKANRLHLSSKSRTTTLDGALLDRCEFASEIALRQMKDRHELTLDALLCDPALASDFDQLASEIAPGFEAIYYRWAALRIRKEAKKSRDSARIIAPQMGTRRFSRSQPLNAKFVQDVPNTSGLYQLRVASTTMYVGKSGNLREWITRAANEYDLSKALQTSSALEVSVLPISFPELKLSASSAINGAKSVVVAKWEPQWNVLMPQAA